MSEKMGRIPPHSDEAERAVLGAALINKDAMFEILQRLKADDFYSQAHKEIFDVILELQKNSEPVDTLTVSNALVKRKTIEMVGGRAYIAELSAGVPSAANAVQYTQIISENAVMRRLIAAAEDITSKSFDGKLSSQDLLDYSEQQIFSIAQHRQIKDYIPVKEILISNLDRIDEASKGNGIIGIPTGFKDLDKFLGGFRRSELIILAARPSMGKTAFALNIALLTSMKHGSTVLAFSHEMAAIELGERLISIDSKVDMEKLQKGELEASDWEKISVAVDRISDANIFIDDTPGIGMMEIKNKCRRLKQEKGLDMVIIDYLQLMTAEGVKSENRQQEITALSRMMKQLAREMDCPVLLLSQLNRAPDLRSEHRPMISDLRESGSIEQDADIVIFLYRDEVYFKEASENPGVCEVIIAKNRRGPTGKVELTWLGRNTKFCDMMNLGKRENDGAEN